MAGGPAPPSLAVTCGFGHATASRWRSASPSSVRSPRVPPGWHDQDPEVLLQVAAAHHLEGIVVKRTDSPYLAGRRSRLWIKRPLLSTQEAVICGWAPGNGGRAATFGGLLLGAYTDGGL